MFDIEAALAYHQALTYVEKWYAYEKSPLKDLSVLNFNHSKNMTLQNIKAASEVLQATIDENKQCDEVVSFNAKLCKVRQAETSAYAKLDKQRPLNEMWSSFFFRYEAF